MVHSVFAVNVSLVPEPEGLLRVRSNHLDEVVAAGSGLEGQMCHTAQIMSLLVSRKRNKDAITPDSFLDLFPESRIPICLLKK